MRALSHPIAVHLPALRDECMHGVMLQVHIYVESAFSGALRRLGERRSGAHPPPLVDLREVVWIRPI